MQLANVLTAVASRERTLALSQTPGLNNIEVSESCGENTPANSSNRTSVTPTYATTQFVHHSQEETVSILAMCERRRDRKPPTSRD